MRRPLSLFIAAALTCAAFAHADTAAPAPAAVAKPAASTNDAAIRRLILAINPESKIKAIYDNPIPGFKTVIADGTVLYVTDDARYVMYGVLLDTKAQQNLTNKYLAEAHVDLLAGIPKDYKLAFAPKNPKYAVTVFTDVTCGYCEAFHKQIQSYLDAGIEVDYVPWPRAGKDSAIAQHMRDVWCSKDPQKAFTDAIGGKYPDKTPACPAAEAVNAMADVGEKLQIEGTPTLFDGKGNKLGGFLSAQALLARLQSGDTLTQTASRK